MLAIAVSIYPEIFKSNHKQKIQPIKNLKIIKEQNKKNKRNDAFINEFYHHLSLKFHYTIKLKLFIIIANTSSSLFIGTTKQTKTDETE